MTQKIQTSSKLLQLALLANAFEWYEFSIYGFLSTFIGKLFFDSNHPTIGLIQAFMSLALGYFVRPLGALFFGLAGDSIGRRYSIRLSLILMAVPTVLIGLLPTYSQAGIYATCALLILRMIQGFAVGGELPLTACYVFESAHPRYKSILCSATAIGPIVGILLASCTILSLTAYFDINTILNWAWRIPFLLGLPLTLFIAYVREKIQETPVFSQIQAVDIGNYSSTFVKRLLQGICLFTFFYIEGPIMMIWMPFYLTHFLGVPLKMAHLSHTLGLLALVIGYFVCGSISQQWGYKKLLVSSIVVSLLLVVQLFKGLQISSSLMSLVALQAVLGLLVSSSNGLFVEIVGHLFKPETRCLGTSLTCALPAALIGGTVPLVCTYVIHQTGWVLFPAFYIMAGALIALPAALCL
jgi:MHS family proline/betaine transporter-like MFS transporter